MILLYKYIFFKAYYFCINVFKEKEFPQIWAGFVVSMLILANVEVLTDIYEYIILPKKINFYDDLHKYVALAFFFLFEIYVNYNKRYQRIIERCKTLEKSKVTVLNPISLIYIVASIFLFFYMADLLRDPH